MATQPVEKAISGKYEVLEKIREGGMGAIYKVRHRLLDEVRIIKVLRSDLAMDEKLRQRFQNEAKFAIQLRHPNIAHLYDFSVSADGTSAYIVMEYIDGVTLQELLAESGAPTLGLAIEVATQALKAISYLHAQGFVHRDIAADNLMLTRDFQGNPLVKLIDLGIAKGQDKSLNLTATGVFMGKVRYSAPELFKAEGGAAALDERSDIYSFGILLYELLTGKSPVSGESFSEIVAGHLFRPPLSFEESDPDGSVPEKLRALVLKTLEKDPAKRISSGEELVTRLSKFAVDGGSHSEEFAQAIQATTQLATLKPKDNAAGSTQDRLDRQFGVDDPSSHPAELDEKREEAVAQAASAIRERTRTGEVNLAGEHLELAVSLYGEHEEFDEVRREIQETTAGGRSRTAPPIAAVRRRPDLLRWLTTPLGLLLTIGIVLTAAGLVTIVVLSKQQPRQHAAVGGDVLTVEAPPRWRPDRGAPPSGDPAGLEPPASANDPSTAPERRPSDPGTRAIPAPPERAPQASGPAAPELRQETVIPPQDPPPVPQPPPPGVRRGELFGPDPGVTPPSLIRVPKPVYPARFDAPRRPLDVMIEVLVSEDGHVITARVGPRESAKKRFRELALETAKGAAFRPATKRGVAGKMWTTIRVTLPPR